MGWVVSNATWVIVAGIVVMVLSSMRKPRRAICWLGAGILVLGVGLYMMSILHGPADTKIGDQKVKPVPLVPTQKEQLQALRQDWDSAEGPYWPAIELLAEVSQASYLPPIDAEPRFRELGFDPPRVFLEDSMVGFLLSSNDVAVVVFRGTDDRFDWFANVNERAANTPYGPIHRGFYEAYQDLKGQVDRLIEAGKSNHLWITGHSLGGAMAVVCAFDIVQSGERTIDGVVTFGQPRVARKQLAGYLDSEGALRGKYVRYVNENDLVPRMPPSNVHCGSMVWFFGDIIKRAGPGQLFAAAGPEDASAMVVDASEDQPPPLTEAEFEAAKAEVRFENSRPRFNENGEPLMYGQPQIIQDHSMSEYLNKIRGLRMAPQSRQNRESGSRISPSHSVKARPW